MAINFRTDYFDRALDAHGLDDVLYTAAERLADVDFDTIVGTGFSGGVVIPPLALRLGKHFVLIRKETDDSHHGGGRLIGSLGHRWLFVDDFISSGATRDRVLRKIREACISHRHETTYVGEYMYSRYNDDDTYGRFTAAEEEN